MRRLLGGLCGLVMLACAENSPSSPESYVSLASLLGADASANNGAGGFVYNTQMRSDLEVPVCPTDSKGHAQVKVSDDGTIDAHVTINNKGGESVRFGHIHHVNPASTTGPVIWWLTSPINFDHNLTDRHITFAQEAAFVTNTHFASHADAVAQLVANPQEFYVNFHSDNCTPGFARGFLP